MPVFSLGFPKDQVILFIKMFLMLILHFLDHSGQIPYPVKFSVHQHYLRNTHCAIALWHPDDQGHFLFEQAKPCEE